MQENYQKPKEPLGSLLFKIGIVLIIIIIGVIVIFGFVLKTFDPVSFLINIVGIILMVCLLALAIKGVLSFLKPKPFSPTEDFRTSLVRIAKKAKPFNIKNLYLRGEDMRTYAKWGKILGLGFLPYVSAKPVKDEKGNILFERDEKGKIKTTKQWSQAEREYVDVPVLQHHNITEKDGDSLFITSRHSFPLNLFLGDLDIIRANPKYHSDLIGDVFIKDVNLVPYGEFYYPAKQWQEDIAHIMLQNQDQAIQTTHRNNLDLVSTTTQMALGADPTFQKIMMAQSERLSSGFVDQSR